MVKGNLHFFSQQDLWRSHQSWIPWLQNRLITIAEHNYSWHFQHLSTFSLKKRLVIVCHPRWWGEPWGPQADSGKSQYITQHKIKRKIKKLYVLFIYFVPVYWNINTFLHNHSKILLTNSPTKLLKKKCHNRIQHRTTKTLSQRKCDRFWNSPNQFWCTVAAL